jgi:hypothetical protein
VKLARFRELLRLNRKWVSSSGAEAVRPFSRKLLLVAEHTWGLDTIMCMADETSYSPEKFQEALKTNRFDAFKASWQEQEDYLEEAIATLDPKKAREARELMERKSFWPEAKAFKRIEAGEIVKAGQFEVAIDAASGAISHLKTGDRVWANATHKLFEFSHQLYSLEELNRYMDDYVLSGTRDQWWIPCALARRDTTQLEGVGGWWPAKFREARLSRSAEGDYLQVSLAAPGDVPKGYGFPESPYLRFFFPKEKPVIEAEIGWEAKQACRHPEAIWTQVNPKVSDPHAWRVEKLGRQISPFDVVKRAGAHLHAAGEEVSCRGQESVTIRPIDAPLVSFGERGIMRADDHETSAADGLYFNLYNNTWATNFPLWYSGPCSFRFAMEFSV